MISVLICTSACEETSGCLGNRHCETTMRQHAGCHKLPGRKCYAASVDAMLTMEVSLALDSSRAGQWAGTTSRVNWPWQEKRDAIRRSLARSHGPMWCAKPFALKPLRNWTDLIPLCSIQDWRRDGSWVSVYHPFRLAARLRPTFPCGQPPCGSSRRVGLRVSGVAPGHC
jgi:hypothetical protein